MRLSRAFGVLGAMSVLLSVMGGCGTVLNLAVGVETGAVVRAETLGLGFETQIYGGVQVDAGAVHKACKDPEGWFHHDVLWLLFVLDFPLSFVADTITLPITIPIVLSRDEKK